MPPIEPIVQYGLLGIFTYVIIWGTIRGYPRWMDSHDNQIKTSGELVKHILSECTIERREMLERFERITEADREARHNTANLFQAAITDFVNRIKMYGVPGSGTNPH